MKMAKKVTKKKVSKKPLPKKKTTTKGKTKVKVKTKTKVKAKVKAKAKTKVKAKVKTKAKPKVKAKIKTKAKPKVKAKAKKAKAVAKPKTKAKKSIKSKIVKRPKKAASKVAKPTKKVQPRIKRSGAKSMFGPVDIRPYAPKKHEEYMNKKQLDHFQELLLKWKEQLMEDVDRTMHHMKDEASNYPDPVDRASQEEEFSLELRTRDRERKLLKKIEETLLRISEQDYGYCDDCGAEVGLRRLEARPTATQCIECKTISEMREKQIGDGSNH